MVSHTILKSTGVSPLTQSGSGLATVLGNPTEPSGLCHRLDKIGLDGIILITKNATIRRSALATTTTNPSKGIVAAGRYIYPFECPLWPDPGAGENPTQGWDHWKKWWILEFPLPTFNWRTKRRNDGIGQRTTSSSSINGKEEEATIQVAVAH